MKLWIGIAVGVMLGIGLTLTTLSGGPPWVAVGCPQGGPCPPDNPGCPGACGNGDVDGSGDIGIQDAIYILLHLFQFGPAPVASTGTAGPSVEEAWDTAKQRHTTITQEIPFLGELEAMAPWIRFPEKPHWFGSARLCSVVLKEDPADYEAACIVSSGTEQMLVRLIDDGVVTTMLCEGGSVDYEISIFRDPGGRIVQELMMAGDSMIVIEWLDMGMEELFRANVNGALYEAPWSVDPGYALALFSDIAAWLHAIGMTGGIIEPVDQPLVILALGELRKPPYDALNIDVLEILQRAMSDFMQGVPQTCM